jgi:hypothetical protein
MISPAQIDSVFESFKNENLDANKTDAKELVLVLMKTKQFSLFAGESLRTLYNTLAAHPPSDGPSPETMLALLKGTVEIAMILSIGYAIGQLAAAEAMGLAAAKEPTNA